MTRHRVIVPVLAYALALALAACSSAPEAPESEPEQSAKTTTVAEDVDAVETEEPPQPTYVRVPNVTADTVQAAATTLEDEGFTVVTVSDWSKLYTNGRVSAQSPSGYALEGSCVTLTVSRGSDPYTIDNGPETRDIPDVRGYPVDEALEDLKEHGFGVTSVDGPENGVVTCYEVTGSAPPSAILHTCPASGGTYDASTPSSMHDEERDDWVDPSVDRSEQPRMDNLN